MTVSKPTTPLWVGILTGVPPVFSAGADLKEINAGRAVDLTTARGGFGGITRRERTKPIIAAVDGPALAGGAEMALACDLIVASTNARFGLPEVKRSLVAAAGGLFRMPRKLPFNVAMELILTGDPIDAQRAHHFGLVNVLLRARPGPGGGQKAGRTASRPMPPLRCERLVTPSWLPRPTMRPPPGVHRARPWRRPWAAMTSRRA